ncbi:MAG: acyltransferase [Pseudomonadota bacterium]
MTRGYSIYLDAIRFLASLLVLFSHVAYPRYSNGDLIWMRELNLGSDAVILFFVLSGFVIAYTTDAKSRTGASYAQARMARLYSVLIPALVVTLLCDFAGRSIDPGAYQGWWFNAHNPLEQVLRALTFSTQAAGDNIRVGTNGPFWSVAYEAWYYAAFGIAVFARGWVRLALLALTVTCAGLSIILLAPCWLAGVALQSVCARKERAQIAPRTAWVLAVGPWVIYALWLAIDLPQTLTSLTFILTFAITGVAQTPFQWLGFADEFLWNNLLAILFAAHFFGVYRLAQDGSWVSVKWETTIRWLAGATFSIYLFHYPLLTLFHALPGYEAANPLHYGGAGIVTLIVCFGLAELSERRLSQWKRIFDGVLGLTDKYRSGGSARKAAVL